MLRLDGVSPASRAHQCVYESRVLGRARAAFQLTSAFPLCPCALARLDPLIKQLDAAKLQLDSKTSALWAAEHALEVSSVEKLAILEDLDKYKIAAAKAAAQNEALRRSLMEELEAGSKYAVRGADYTRPSQSPLAWCSASGC